MIMLFKMPQYGSRIPAPKMRDSFYFFLKMQMNRINIFPWKPTTVWRGLKYAHQTREWATGAVSPAERSAATSELRRTAPSGLGRGVSFRGGEREDGEDVMILQSGGDCIMIFLWIPTKGISARVLWTTFGYRKIAHGVGTTPRFVGRAQQTCVKKYYLSAVYHINSGGWGGGVHTRKNCTDHFRGR